MTTIVLSGYKFNKSISNEEIERRARGLGMDYPSEFKVISKEESK